MTRPPCFSDATMTAFWVDILKGGMLGVGVADYDGGDGDGFVGTLNNKLRNSLMAITNPV